ncbi:MAG: O-antigen ligase family protein [Anaerolineae bacterium]
MSSAPARIVEAGGLAAALLLPLCFNPYARVPFEPAKIALFWAIVAVMGAAWLGWRLPGLLSRQPSQAGPASTGRWLFWTAITYAGAVILATVLSVDRRLSLWGTPDDPAGAVTLLAGVLFFVLLTSVLRRPAQINRLVQMLILASVPITVYGFAQALGLDPLPWITDSVSPVHATLGRSNFLGAYLAMVAPWTLALAVLGSRHGFRYAADGYSTHGADGFRYAADGYSTDDRSASGSAAGSSRLWIILILQVVCLALTLARGAWLGLTVGCVVLLALLAIRWRERRFWLAAGLALIIGAVVLAALTFVRLPAGSRQAAAAGMSYPELRVESALRRSVIWQHALALAPQRWPLGYGPATFEQVFSSRYPPGTLYQGADAVVDDPHNILLERLLATGVLGLAACAGVVAAFYGTGLALLRRSSDRRTDALLAAALASVAAYLTQALFNPDVIVLSMLFWLALAVVAAVAQMDPVTVQENR